MILFICTGNICRSPAADGILRALFKQQKKEVYVDSAALGSWHIGDPPDSRAIEAAKNYGFDISFLKARQIQEKDFYHFDEIIAMDDSHYHYLIQNKPQDSQSHITYFCDWFKDEKGISIKDPYYGSMKDFTDMVQEIVEGCKKISQSF